MKYKYFFKNLSIFTISNFISKLLLFFMLPLYTNYLSSNEYGIIDIVTTTVQLSMPIFTLCINEAIIRFTIDKDKNKNQVLKISLGVFIKGYCLILLLSIISYFLFYLDITYLLLFNVYYIVLTISNIYIYFLKGLERIKIIGISSILKIIMLVCMNCIMILWLNLGVIGYILSLIISELLNIIILYLDYKKIKPTLKSNNIENKELRYEMISYSKHFILNSISWWINNAADKYILLFYFGSGITGIYAIAYKIPTIIEFVQNVFAQAWQISAIKEYKHNNSKRFFSNMYNYYNIILIFTVCLILIFLKIIAKILFAKDFYDAWKYVPFLLIAILFGALSGFLGSIYAANKDSKMYAKSTLVGAISNIILNIILIPKFGAYGAAFSTAISYFEVWILRLLFMKKYIVLDVSHKRNILSYTILIIISFCIIFLNTLYSTFICCISFLIFILIYLDYIKKIFKLLIKEGNYAKNRNNDVV